MKAYNIFSFKKKEIESAFKTAHLKNRCSGLKLLIATQPSLAVTEHANESTSMKAGGSLVITEQIEVKYGKLLIIIGRRVGKACLRNRLRRRIKAIYYEEKLYTKPTISILLVYKQAIKLSFSQIKDFLKINLLT